MCLLIPLISTCGHTALYLYSCVTQQTTLIGRAEDPYRTHEEDFPTLLEHSKECPYTTLDISHDTCLPGRCKDCITAHNTELIWASPLNPDREKRLALHAAVKLCSFGEFVYGEFMQTTRLVFKRQADWRLLNDVVDKLDQVLYYRDEIHERERAKAEKSGVASEDQPPRDLSQDAIAQFVFRVAPMVEASKLRYLSTEYQIVTQIEGNTPEQEEILVRAISIEEVPEEDRHCGICRITMGVPDEGAEARIERPVITGCKHVFGDLCLKQWASEREEPDCPLCRKRIEFPKVMPTIDQRIEADITLEENITTCIELFPLREILDAGNYTRFDYILTEKKLARDIQAMILTVGLPEKSDEGGEAR